MTFFSNRLPFTLIPRSCLTSKVGFLQRDTFAARAAPSEVSGIYSLRHQVGIFQIEQISAGVLDVGGAIEEQSLAIEVLHDEIVSAVLVPNVVERANMGMAKRRDRARFTLETLLQFKVLRKMLGQNLDATVRSSPVSRAR